MCRLTCFSGSFLKQRPLVFCAHQRRLLSRWSLEDGPFRQYTETRLIGFSVNQMYDIAANVQHYNQFVPWCLKSELKQQISGAEADWLLEVGFPPIKERYVSRVTCSRPDFVKSQCADGKTLQYLENIWIFRPGDTENSCLVEFYVGFQFTNLFYTKLSALFFAQVVNQMTSAFEKRANVLYGDPSFKSKTVRTKSL